MPSPQVTVVQSLRQPSVLLPLPSSHCSPGSSTTSPHTVQSLRQLLPFPPPGKPAGSQVSPFCGSTMPSPHTGMVQLLRQASPLMPLPSSHCSPALTTPSPQEWQVAEQLLPLPPAGEPGGSQVSPFWASTMPSPHTG